MKVFYKDRFTETVEISPDNAHFRYGAGFFETILYDNGEIKNLNRHIKRIKSSSEEFGFNVYDFDYEDVISRLINENGLSDGTARVNVCHMASDLKEYSVFVSTVSYTPPPSDKVFRLCVYPHVHDSYLNLHKSMNYMHFLLAKKYAVENNCDDSILLDKDGFVLETSTAALLFENGGYNYISESAVKLKSLSLEIFMEKHTVKPVKIAVDDLLNYNILIMNSLMGSRRAELVQL